MYYCNDLFSLSVLSLNEGELIGVVDKLYFDKKLKKLIQLELVGENGARLILAAKNIYKVGKNAITIKSKQFVDLKIENQELYLCPLNSKAFSINGEFLGVIKEIAINEKFNTEKISLDSNKTLELSQLATLGRNAVVFYEDVPKTKHNIDKTKIMDQQIKPIKEIEIIHENNPPINTNDFLIGRICSKDIFGFNNELLIKAHSVVNKKNLKEIKKFGKLRELMIWIK